MNALRLVRSVPEPLLVEGEMPRPQPQPGEVVVRVHAVAVTPTELLWYSVTRARANNGYSKETLAVFDHIPSRKAALFWLALKFGFRDDSVSVITEGLGPKAFHGKIAVLVDGTTTGASERIAAFAQERNLHTVRGSRRFSSSSDPRQVSSRRRGQNAKIECLP